MANEVSYGFVKLEDVYTDRATVVGMETITTAIADSIRLWTEQISQILTKFVEVTTETETVFWLPDGGGLQPLDDDGNPIPVRYTGSYTVGFPIRWAGTAYGTNRETRVKATVADYDRWTSESMKADAVWMRRQVIKALLWSASWVFTDKSRPRLPAVTVQPLANDDAVTYERSNGTSSIDNHYLAQAAAIADAANPFPTIFAELQEHPSNNVDETGVVTVYVATSLITTIEGLTDIKDLNSQAILPGISADRLDESIVRQYQALGGRFIGYIDGCLIYEWSALPAGYMVAHAPGAGAVLKMREEPEPELKGFFKEESDVDGNHKVVRLLRKAGFGVFNRVAALAYYIGGASYVNPAGFNATSAK